MGLKHLRETQLLGYIYMHGNYLGTDRPDVQICVIMSWIAWMYYPTWSAWAGRKWIDVIGSSLQEHRRYLTVTHSLLMCFIALRLSTRYNNDLPPPLTVRTPEQAKCIE